MTWTHLVALKRAATPFGLFLSLAATGLGPMALRADEATNRFGFAGPEIFPIDNLISHLRAADFNGDGLEDLLVVNNARSKINLLINQTGRAEPEDLRPVKLQLNELPRDARFRLESLASEKRIASLVVADLNGDRRPDLAYFGEPKELVVQYREGTNAWSAPKRWAMDDGLLDFNALAEGDLNGDGRTDLLLVGESALHFLAQKEDHLLAEPERIPYSGTVKAAQVLDINGDGRQDLLLVNWDQANPFRFRLQNETGQLGPEVHFALPAIRSYWPDDLDGDARTEVVTIAQKSGRAQISNFVSVRGEPLAGDYLEGQFQLQPLGRTTKSRRGILWADVNADRRADLVVADPDGGQLTLFLQETNGVLAAPRTFPSFTGIAELAAADWNGDGKTEVFLLSADERQVGVTTYEEGGRMPFPTMIPIEGRPLAMAVGPLQPGGKPLLAVLSEQDGRRVLVLRGPDAVLRTRPFSESFKANPAGLVLHDADQDGRTDLLVMIPYEKLRVLRQTDDLEFIELEVAPPGGSSDQPWLSAADVDGDGKAELLLAQKNFVRAVVLTADSPAAEGATPRNWSLRVKEQINGASTSSRIIGAAPIHDRENRVAGLFLLDAEGKSLTLSQRDQAGVWQTRRNVPLPFTEFSGIQTIRLGSDQENAVAFLGPGSVAWLPLFGDVWRFTELDDYETPIRDGLLHDVVSGDLNNDGRKDLVFLETAKNYLDIVTFEPPHRLVPANRWQVFEERSFRPRVTGTAEPREALIADFTGDQRTDLAVLVHDRILLYPQD